MEQPFELFYKLVFAWLFICTWFLIFLYPGLLNPYIRNGVSGNGWDTSICLVLQHDGNIISFGQSLRLQLLFLALALVAGQSPLLQSHAGIGPKMWTY